MSLIDLSLIDDVVRRTIRPDLLAQAAYAVPDASGMVKLEAMENPYTLPDDLRIALAQHLAAIPLNRYPVPSYRALKAKICHHFGVPAGFDVILGNGSDENISMLVQACAHLGQHGQSSQPSQPGDTSKSGEVGTVLAAVPTFVMYAISAKLSGMNFVGVDLNPDLSLNLPAMLAAIAQHQPRLVFLSYPNNPTGTLYSDDEMTQIIRAAPGLVVVDEAYQPFAETSFMPRLPEFENLVVVRTVSKLGLAGIRLGFMAAHPAWLAQIDKVRPPYNINVLTQASAEFLLDHIGVFDAQAAQLRAARAQLISDLRQLGVQVFPSAANFLLIRVANAEQVFNNLLKCKILVKNVGKMHSLLSNCLRINVSTAQENSLLLAALKDAANTHFLKVV